jgi:hypothetical protein
MYIFTQPVCCQWSQSLPNTFTYAPRYKAGYLSQYSEGYRLIGRDSFPGRGKRFYSLLYGAQTDPENHPASYPMGTVGKTAGA